MSESPTQKPPSGRRLWVLLAVIVVGVASGAVAGRLLLGGTRYSSDPRLDRAARAVVARADVKGRTVVVQGRAGVVLPPLEAYLDRERALRLGIESGRLRRQALDALRAGGDPQKASLQVAALSVFARGRLAGYLKVDDEHAQLLLYAMDWPWVGLKAEDWRPAELPAPGVWPPLTQMSPADVQSALEVARAAVAWPEAQRTLLQPGKLTPEQALAVRAQILRLALGGAFESAKGDDAAREALTKYADLAPQQADAVLAMAGAQALARAGEAALPALDVMARRHGALADALQEALRTGGL